MSCKKEMRILSICKCSKTGSQYVLPLRLSKIETATCVLTLKLEIVLQNVAADPYYGGCSSIMNRGCGQLHISIGSITNKWGIHKLLPMYCIFKHIKFRIFLF